MPRISAIILAGGEGKRAQGRDKGLLPLDGKPLIAHVINRITSQVDEIIISANRNIEAYQRYGFPVVSDDADSHHPDAFRGPLAGIAAGLIRCNHDRVLVVPCDMPYLPADLVSRLSTDGTTGINIVEHASRLQLVFLMERSHRASIQRALDKNELSLMRWVRSEQHHIVQFDHIDHDDKHFMNFNKGA